MSDHGDALAPGTRLEQFEVVRELAAGGFGITYLAKDVRLGRPVAVKEYLPQDWGTRRFDGTIGPRSSSVAGDYEWGLERFLDEARILAFLNHPHIVSVYQIIEDWGTAYLVMEYIEGRSLADELRVAGRLGEARVRAILGGLAAGLEEVHGAGLLHRDIKPANVMLKKSDDSPVLIDFGSARQQMGQHSRGLTAVLTPGYAPIEQYNPKGNQGPWTDIYALGAVAYVALSGHEPEVATERVRGDDPMPGLALVAPGVSDELARAVDVALAVDEGDRPQDVAAWREMLEVPLAGVVGEARPPFSGLRRDGRRQRMGSAPSGGKVSEERRGRDRPGAVAGWKWVVGAVAAVLVVGSGLYLGPWGGTGGEVPEVGERGSACCRGLGRGGRWG